MEANCSHPLTPIFQTRSPFVPAWSPGVDPRVAHLPMTGGFHEAGSVLGLYLLFVLIGPKLMEKREPWNLQPVIVAYNAGLTILSLYMTVEFALAALENNVNWLCAPVDYATGPGPQRMANICWLYYFSKIIELVETVFFILRKKNNQVSFLHVFHHASMVSVWWCVSRWIPGGISFFSAMVNCSVHVVMYSYYFLSSLGPIAKDYLWWKRYITQFQLLQFTSLMAHDLYVWYADCGYPRYFALVMVFYMLSFFGLFNSFYSKAYVKADGKSKLA